MRKSKGSMVIYLAIIMPVLILFFGICLDVVRIKYARSKVSASLYSSLDSILADYNREIFSHYGIFVLRDKDYSRDFWGFIRGNLKGSNIEISNFSFKLKEPLSNTGVLKKQILEDMKIKGLVNFSKDFYELFKGFTEVEDLSLEGGGEGNYIESLNERVKRNMEEIKSLEVRKEKGEEELDGRIEELYRENKELLLLIEDLADGIVDTASISSSIDEKTLKKLGELFKDDFKEMAKHFFDLGYAFHKSRGLAADVNDSKNWDFKDLRDKFLLGEYVLDHFSNVSTGEALAERIIGIGFPSNAVMEVLLLRTFLDGTGYFFFDPNAPGDPGERLAYSAVAGLISGLDDTLALASGAKVSLIRVEGFETGFENIKVDYRNHLQLLLLTVSDEYILGEIYDEITDSLGGEGYTGVAGEVEGKVDLLFLSFLPEGFGFLGGSVKDRCFYFVEEADLYFF